MIHPDYFGFPNYPFIVRAIAEHGCATAPDLGVRLNKRGGLIQAVVQKHRHHAITEHYVSKQFEMNPDAIKKGFERITQEMYFEGAAQGFQVEDKNHRIHERTEHELLEWREAKNLVDSLNQSSDTRWYILPIGKEREWQVKTLGHTQTLIESLQFARDRNLNTCTRAELISLVQTGMIVADKAQRLAEERKRNLRATRLREQGKEVTTISREEYEDMFTHTAVLKALINDPSFTEDLHHMLSTVEVDELDEYRRFDATVLMPGREK